MLQVIHRMANNLWSYLDLPAVWVSYRLKTLWKGKGSKLDPSKYRGLSIKSTVWKLIINIILERIRPWYEAQPKLNWKKQTLYLLFVEVTAAFDRIPRKLLLDSIRIPIPEG